VAELTNEADIAAVTEVVSAYYDGMIRGDEALLGRVFHPRACIVGHLAGELYWKGVEDFIVDSRESASRQGPREWRLERLSFTGDTALVTVGDESDGAWYSDDLSLLKVDGRWRIVHKTFYAHPGGEAGRSRG